MGLMFRMLLAGLAPAWLVLLVAVPATADGGEAVALGAADLDRTDTLGLLAGWRVRLADDPAFADPELDDRGWSAVDNSLVLPPGWQGVGWFRLHLEVAPSAVGRPIGLWLRDVGAGELFLDGERIIAAGTIGADAASTDARRQMRPAIVTFERPGRHLLALRYANHRGDRFRAVGADDGFGLRVGSSDRLIARAVADQRWLAGNLGAFTAIFLSFALLHALLFAFDPQASENAWFAALCAICALLVYLLLRREQVDDPGFLLVSEPAMNAVGLALGLVALRFVYGVFRSGVPVFFHRAVLPVAGVLGVFGIWRPTKAVLFAFLFMLAASAEMVRNVALGLMHRRAGARVVGFGVAALAVGFGIGLLANLGVLPASRLSTFTLPFVGMAVLVASMSVHLSHAFARNQRALRAQLRRVEELSAARLEEERRRRREEVERTALEADLERKRAELEEARQLQLSMLPESVPQTAQLAVAARMATATEVGGDYYDFALGDRDELVVAIGDATGHGMRAGTMVTATKSLFQTLAAEDDLPGALERAGMALGRMRLRRLSMALSLARFAGGRLQLAAAGMPPALVLRRATGEVESLEVAGLPLGSRLPGRYRQTETRLDAGDVVLLMSDGFPERQDPAGELFGYPRAAAAFARAAATGAAPEAVIDNLQLAADEWADGEPAEDDQTFVVVRVR